MRHLLRWSVSCVSFAALIGLVVTGTMYQAPATAQTMSESAQPSTDPTDAFSRGVQAVKDKNFQLAINLFETAASRSEYEAQYNLAYLLRHGKGRPQNYTEALYWVKLAQLGGIELAEDLADEIEDRLSEKQLKPVLDRVASALERRIEAGEFEAIPQLAAYHHSLLPEPDFEQAYLWYAIAAALSLPEVIDLREDMEDELEPEQIGALQEESTAIFNRLLAGEPIRQPQSEAADEN